MKALFAAITAFLVIAGPPFDSGEAGSGLAFAQGQAVPRLSNGRIESHTTTNISRDVPALAATLTEPMWIGYAQPMIELGQERMGDLRHGRLRATRRVVARFPSRFSGLARGPVRGHEATIGRSEAFPKNVRYHDTFA